MHTVHVWLAESNVFLHWTDSQSRTEKAIMYWGEYPLWCWWTLKGQAHPSHGPVCRFCFESMVNRTGCKGWRSDPSRRKWLELLGYSQEVVALRGDMGFESCFERGNGDNVLCMLHIDTYLMENSSLAVKYCKQNLFPRLINKSFGLICF